MLATAIDAEISSKVNKAGERVTTTISSDIKDATGRVLIPAGSKVMLTISEIHESENKGDKTGKLTLTPTSVQINGESYALAGTAVALDRYLKSRPTNGGDVAKVGAGTAIGAVAGRVIGGNTKGAVIGGLIGGAIGTQRAIQTHDRDVDRPRGIAGRVDAVAGTRALSPASSRRPRLHRSDGHQEREVGVVAFALLVTELLGRHSGEERDRGENIAVGPHGDPVLAEPVGEQLGTRRRGEAPVIPDRLELPDGPAHGGDGGQQDAAGPQDAGGVAQGRSGVVDELERLGQDEAVVAVGRHGVGRGEIGDDGSLRVGRVYVEHVRSWPRRYRSGGCIRRP